VYAGIVGTAEVAARAMDTDPRGGLQQNVFVQFAEVVADSQFGPTLVAIAHHPLGVRLREFVTVYPADFDLRRKVEKALGLS